MCPRVSHETNDIHAHGPRKQKRAIRAAQHYDEIDDEDMYINSSRGGHGQSKHGLEEEELVDSSI